MKLLHVALFSLLSMLLSGCWFVFIPGSVIDAVADGVTGSEGEHCVGDNVKVGDRMNAGNGRSFEVVSLSGRTSRCSNPVQPIRAKLKLL